jgi:glycosyltransferase involved in cell wall biosynthesis
MHEPHQVDITLLICTHNNAGVLARTLTAIAGQRVSSAVSWEVLVVDNNCTDNTAALVRNFQEARGIPIMHRIGESRQGVGYARRLGLTVGRGKLVAFVDDDCFLDADWVEQAVEFAAAHPQAGAFGGRNELEWEQTPTELCLAYGASLARQDFGAEPLRMPARGKRLPCGAGLVLRREALLQSGYLERGLLVGRDPVRLGAGEDTEIALHVRRAGWEVWYTPLLRLRHFIPAWRMSLPYLCRLHRGFGRAEVYLRTLARHRRLTLLSLVRGLGWSIAELGRVIARFPAGFVCYLNERPTWWIRWHYALGCIEGVVHLFFRSDRLRGRPAVSRGTPRRFVR